MKKIKKLFLNITIPQLIVIALILCFIIGGSAAFLITRSFLNEIDGALVNEVVSQPQNFIKKTEIEVSSVSKPEVTPRVAGIYKKKSSVSATNFLDQLYIKEELLGRGAVLTSDGWFITYMGIVNGYTKDELVIIFDSQIYDVEKIEFDLASQVVFLKVSAQNLPVNRLGESADIQAGDIIFLSREDNMVINYLEDIHYINVKERENLLQSSEEHYSFFLLQNSIDDGFVGGPVFNNQGEVIGLLTNQDNNKLVIPINHFYGFITDVLRGEEISRPYLGVKFIDLSQSAGLTKEDGAYNIRGIKLNSLAGAFIYNSPVLVNAVVSKSPAMEAGLQPKDLIIKVEDVAVNEFNNLTSLIQEYNPGDKIKLTVLRVGEEKLLIEVELGELTADLQ